jgi:hypothetical protein
MAGLAGGFSKSKHICSILVAPYSVHTNKAREQKIPESFLGQMLYAFVRQSKA